MSVFSAINLCRNGKYFTSMLMVVSFMFGIITRMKEQETRCTVHFSFRKSQSEHFALMMMMTYDDDHCIRQQ